MENYLSVLAFVDRTTKELQDLHDWLLNAGFGRLKYEKSITGHEPEDARPCCGGGLMNHHPFRNGCGA